MDWKDIAGKVGAVAPLLGSLLGGPAGSLVGSVVASALGSASDPASVETALLASPEALARVREVESNNRVELERLAYQAEATRLQAEQAVYAAEAADRASARELAAKQPNDLVRPSIVFLLLVGALFVLVAVTLGWAREVMADATMSLTLGTVIGYWFNEMKGVMGFYFGMTKDASVQAKTITDFAVTPGSVSKPTSGI
jgi:hypothetical protein